MKDLLEKNSNLFKPPRIGEIVEGKIISKGKSSVILDLGKFGTGIIYGREFIEAKDELKKLNIGENIFAKVIDLDNEEGYVELSFSEAGKEIAWKILEQKKEKGETLKVKILGANKGGLLAEISEIPAFLPTSQLSPEHYPKVEDGDQMKILRALQKFTGKELEVKIFDIDPKKGKLILSEKAKDSEKIKELLKNFKIGDVIEGEISGLVDFGAFIKFPVSQSSFNPSKEYLEGLIHISELDWQVIENPTEILKIGDKVKAKIMEIVDDKVFLSLKALKKDPWEGMENYLKKGEIIEGKVIKFNSFGAFVEIPVTFQESSEKKEIKIQGLAHISEFGSEEKMKKSLEIGKKYKFEILLIDSKEHRLNLKLID